VGVAEMSTNASPEAAMLGSWLNVSPPVHATASSVSSGESASASQPFKPSSNRVDKIESKLGSSSTSRDTVAL
jgi:hypothetical protein